MFAVLLKLAARLRFAGGLEMKGDAIARHTGIKRGFAVDEVYGEPQSVAVKSAGGRQVEHQELRCYGRKVFLGCHVT